MNNKNKFILKELQIIIAVLATLPPPLYFDLFYNVMQLSETFWPYHHRYNPRKRIRCLSQRFDRTKS